MRTAMDRIPKHLHRVGISRREVLQVGFLGAFGMSMASAFGSRTAEAQTRGSRAKGIILVWMPGGPPQMHLWDLKPDSPGQMRGSARPIGTAVPGIQVGHWLPLTAQQARRLALLRTVTLGAEDDNHNLGHHKCLAAIDFKPPGSGDYVSRHDWPSIGSVVTAIQPSPNGLPSAIHLPVREIDGGRPVPGESAGCLGSRYDPWHVNQDPSQANFRVPDLQPLPGFTVERIHNRRKLLAAIDAYRRDLDRDLAVRQLGDVHAKAFTVATSPATRHAFDLSQEPEPLRDRYGRHTYGQSLLLARRLIQAGVRFVQVNLGPLNTWDMHQAEDGYLNRLMPPFDHAFSALLEDLAQQGMLDETLVICMGEMGRNPKLGAPTAGGTPGIPDGRNHWQWCWTAVFAGGGIRGGNVVGESDENAGYPAGEAYYPSAIGATIYHLLGIDPQTELSDLQGRPLVVNQGEVIRKLL